MFADCANSTMNSLFVASEAAISANIVTNV